MKQDDLKLKGTPLSRNPSDKPGR